MSLQALKKDKIGH